jgi:bacillithiol system protein YtxJ
MGLEAELIRELPELDALLERSHRAPVYLFKHSLTCPVSRWGWREFKAFVEEQPDDTEAAFAYLEIQRTRDLSHVVAEKTNVRHQSPQVLKLVDGASIWDASHGDITVKALRETFV